MMDKDRKQEQLTAFVLGELEQGEWADLQKMIECDPGLLQEFKTLQQDHAVIQKVFQELSLPAFREGQVQQMEEYFDRSEHRKSVWEIVSNTLNWKILIPAVSVCSLAFFVLQQTYDFSSLPGVKTADTKPAAPTDEVTTKAAGKARAVPATTTPSAKQTAPGRIAYLGYQDGVIDGSHPADQGNFDGGRIHGTPWGTPLGLYMSSARKKGKFQVQIGGSTPLQDNSDIGSSSRTPSTGSTQVLSSAPRSAEVYDQVDENPFISPLSQPLSTFSLEVDTTSYSNIRRYLQQGQIPPKDAIRIEEMINYFEYDYRPPTREVFSIDAELGIAPWNEKHRLLKIGLKGKEVDWAARPPANLVFLIDVSGSMLEENKLPLLKRSLALLVEKLGENDRIAIVVYAGASGLHLPSTQVTDKYAILDALNGLTADGSTNGGAGIQLAYEVARQHFVPNGINRVILATDGDFNVGTTSQSELVQLIINKAKDGVYLTVFGFGIGNIKDSTLEKLADNGNGNYAYIDSLEEAEKVLERQIAGTLLTIANDVKIQVEFNPATVRSYRLIGYENRLLSAQDFNDDTKDAGEVGAGHTVTALYEIDPHGGNDGSNAVDALKYQSGVVPTSHFGELLTIKLRYKEPRAAASEKLTHIVKNQYQRGMSRDFKFAAAVAAFGMILKDSKHKGNADYPLVRRLVQQSKGPDEQGDRQEFSDLVTRCMKPVTQGGNKPEEIVIVGNHTREQIVRVFDKHLTEIRYCYEKQLQRNPNLAGRITIKFLIAPDGKVLWTKKAAATFEHAALETCIFNQMNSWLFPKTSVPGETTEVTIPLHLNRM